ncbi:MAG TPA: hypothetical protein VK590_15920 [Saprospiraceae bacterium]|nr:hypothetical protein [Saprospiraceae bacterium]
MGKYAFLLLIAILSCKSIKYTSAQLPDKQIIIGESGGFSGIETSFILCASGQVFKQIFPANKTEEITGLDVKKLKKLYKIPWKKKWDKYTYDKPGNLTHYISLKNGDKLHKISWSTSDTLVSKELKTYYRDFYQLLNSKSK